MTLPNIDIKELKKMKENNFKDRLKFIEMYAEWLKKSPNKKWSSEHGNIITK